MATKLSKTGVLLLNLGTPNAPTVKAVRRYLNEFLSDKRVVNLPSLLWQPLLKGFILPFRAKKTTRAYQSIWQEDGSPLLSISLQQAALLQKALDNKDREYIVEVGMRYGNPGIKHALSKLKDHHIDHLIVLPLYPQYSTTTTLSTFDKVTEILKTWAAIPQFTFIRDHHIHPDYIAALANSVKTYWDTHQPPQQLLMSFHGLPQKLIAAGDPYYEMCLATAAAVARQLQLTKNQWQVTFQSRFGPAPWLQPYTDEVVTQLAQQGVESVHLLCPGFSADCLETLEEISIENRNLFLNAGGKEHHYIPALNTQPQHIQLMRSLVQTHSSNSVLR